MALQSCFCLVFVAIMLTVQFHCVMGNLDIQDLRLTRGPSLNEGRVDVQINEIWYAVCEEDWDVEDSRVACRQLGYSTVEEVDIDIRPGSLTFLPRRFNCNGDETTLSECSTASVSCRKRDRDEAAYARCIGKIAKDTTTVGWKSQSPRSQPFPTGTVAAVVGTVLGLLLLLAVLLCYFYRKRARSHEDMTDHVGMGEPGTVQHDDDEHDYNTIQDPAVNNKGLPVIPTAPPSEHDENYSTIPDIQSSPTGGRVDERAPAPPPSQTDVYYSVVRDNDTASPADQAGTSGTAKTTQEPEYAVLKKASKRKENKKEESDQGTGAPGPEYAVVNKNHKKDPKTEGKGNNQSGTVDNVIYERY